MLNDELVYTLYTSTEPCVMCAEAIHWARLSRVIYGVSQVMLQQLTGGQPKPTTASIINSGYCQVEVIGPLLPEEGLAVFEGYQFIPKTVRRRQAMVSGAEGLPN